MSLVFLMKGVMEWLAREGVLNWGDCRKLSLNSLMLFPFVSFIEDKLWKKSMH